MYGVDTSAATSDFPFGTGVATEWVSATGDWSSSSLLAGTDAAHDKLRRIVAVRVAIAVKTSELAATDVNQTQYVMFPDDATNKVTVSLSGIDQRFRVQVYESIVPIRNTPIADRAKIKGA
jgi:hypothetical protein